MVLIMGFFNPLETQLSLAIKLGQLPFPSVRSGATSTTSLRAWAVVQAICPALGSSTAHSTQSSWSQTSSETSNREVST